MVQADPIEVFRGDTLTIDGAAVNDDGTPFDLTGYKVLFTVKASLDTNATDLTALILKNVTSGTMWSSGIFTISCTTTDTTLAQGTYYYNLRVAALDDSVVVSTYNGSFIILLGTTQRE